MKVPVELRRLSQKVSHVIGIIPTITHDVAGWRIFIKQERVYADSSWDNKGNHMSSELLIDGTPCRVAMTVHELKDALSDPDAWMAKGPPIDPPRIVERTLPSPDDETPMVVVKLQESLSKLMPKSVSMLICRHDTDWVIEIERDLALYQLIITVQGTVQVSADTEDVKVSLSCRLMIDGVDVSDSITRLHYMSVLDIFLGKKIMPTNVTKIGETSSAFGFGSVDIRKNSVIRN